jgi:hypothetical protein
VIPFKVVSDFAPAGDQPAAVASLTEGIEQGLRFQTLLGITGSGKSATIAWTIENVQKPTLILAPNKSLAAQLAQEMREFFPDNRVEYFVSYYDYYQPEAYMASSDTYIEKDSSVNDEIDRLRHSATAALLTRRDTIVVASVSCIYGMGNPAEYKGQLLELHTGVDYDQRSILRRLVDLQFDRNDIALGRGKFRVRGDTIEVHPSYDENVLRIEMFGDQIEKIELINPLTGEAAATERQLFIYPAVHYVMPEERVEAAVVRGPDLDWAGRIEKLLGHKGDPWNWQNTEMLRQAREASERFATEENIEVNFGMASPEGYRKAMRLMRLAEKYGLPVVSLVDTPGAYPGSEAEARGKPLAEVFRTIDETTREPAMNPTHTVLREDRVAVSAAHALLLHKERHLPSLEVQVGILLAASVDMLPGVRGHHEPEPVGHVARVGKPNLEPAAQFFE